VATTDFFMPIVDDPFDFGRIAAANALSDVYAMGGTPILALALLAVPIQDAAAHVIREILRGGEAICAEAGSPSRAVTALTPWSPSTGSRPSGSFTRGI